MCLRRSDSVVKNLVQPSSSQLNVWPVCTRWWARNLASRNNGITTIQHGMATSPILHNSALTGFSFRRNFLYTKNSIKSWKCSACFDCVDFTGYSVTTLYAQALSPGFPQWAQITGTQDLTKTYLCNKISESTNWLYFNMHKIVNKPRVVKFQLPANISHLNCSRRGRFLKYLPVRAIP